MPFSIANFVITPHDKVGKTTPGNPFQQSKFTFKDVYTGFLDAQISIKKAKDFLQQRLDSERLSKKDQADFANLASQPTREEEHAKEEKRQLSNQQAIAELPKHVRQKLRLRQFKRLPQKSFSLRVSSRKTTLATSMWDDMKNGRLDSARTSLLILETTLKRAGYANSVRAFSSFIRFILCGDVVTMDDTIDENNIGLFPYYLSSIEGKANSTISNILFQIAKSLRNYGVEDFIVEALRNSLNQLKFLFPEGRGHLSIPVPLFAALRAAANLDEQHKMALLIAAFTPCRTEEVVSLTTERPTFIVFMDHGRKLMFVSELVSEKSVTDGSGGRTISVIDVGRSDEVRKFCSLPHLMLEYALKNQMLDLGVWCTVDSQLPAMHQIGMDDLKALMVRQESGMIKFKVSQAELLPNVSAASVNQNMQDALFKLFPLVEKEKVSFYGLRHNSLTHCIGSKMSLTDIQVKCGHKIGGTSINSYVEAYKGLNVHVGQVMLHHNQDGTTDEENGCAPVDDSKDVDTFLNGLRENEKRLYMMQENCQAFFLQEIVKDGTTLLLNSFEATIHAADADDDSEPGLKMGGLAEAQASSTTVAVAEQTSAKIGTVQYTNKKSEVFTQRVKDLIDEDLKRNGLWIDQPQHVRRANWAVAFCNQDEYLSQTLSLIDRVVPVPSSLSREEIEKLRSQKGTMKRAFARHIVVVSAYMYDKDDFKLKGNLVHTWVETDKEKQLLNIKFAKKVILPRKLTDAMVEEYPKVFPNRKAASKTTQIRGWLTEYFKRNSELKQVLKQIREDYMEYGEEKYGLELYGVQRRSKEATKFADKWRDRANSIRYQHFFQRITDMGYSKKAHDEFWPELSLLEQESDKAKSFQEYLQRNNFEGATRSASIKFHRAFKGYGEYMPPLTEIVWQRGFSQEKYFPKKAKEEEEEESGDDSGVTSSTTTTASAESGVTSSAISSSTASAESGVSSTTTTASAESGVTSTTTTTTTASAESGVSSSAISSSTAADDHTANPGSTPSADATDESGVPVSTGDTTTEEIDAPLSNPDDENEKESNNDEEDITAYLVRVQVPQDMSSSKRTYSVSQWSDTEHDFLPIEEGIIFSRLKTHYKIHLDNIYRSRGFRMLKAAFKQKPDTLHEMSDDVFLVDLSPDDLSTETLRNSVWLVDHENVTWQVVYLENGKYSYSLHHGDGTSAADNLDQYALQPPRKILVRKIQQAINDATSDPQSLETRKKKRKRRDLESDKNQDTFNVDFGDYVQDPCADQEEASSSVLVSPGGAGEQSTVLNSERDTPAPAPKRPRSADYNTPTAQQEVDLDSFFFMEDDEDEDEDDEGIERDEFGNWL